MYDKNNVFLKMINGEIPVNFIIENEYAMSFYDINPLFEKHILVIPRGQYENILDFSKNASPEEQLGFWNCFSATADKLGIAGDFNIMANAGSDAPFVKQTVFHFHLHLVAGKRLTDINEMLKG